MAQNTNKDYYKKEKPNKNDNLKAKQRFVASGKGLKIEPPKKNTKKK